MSVDLRLGTFRFAVYADRGRVIFWGEDLGDDIALAMRSGEVFTLIRDGAPVSKVLMDGFGTIRERPILPSERLTSG